LGHPVDAVRRYCHLSDILASGNIIENRRLDVIS